MRQWLGKISSASLDCGEKDGHTESKNKHINTDDNRLSGVRIRLSIGELRRRAYTLVFAPKNCEIPPAIMSAPITKLTMRLDSKY